MQHRIPADDLRRQIGPQIDYMTKAVESCVHCGFCLPTCPTYLVLEEENDSPRGRIVLMKGVLEGEIGLDAAVAHIDACLGCEACETSCPSGVRYGELLTPFRALAEQERQRSGPLRRPMRRLLLSTLMSPRRFRMAAAFGRLARPLRRWLPRRLAAPLELLPTGSSEASAVPAITPARGSRRGRVALLAGCVERVLRPGLLPAVARVLSESGVEVVVPAAQACCGSLALHAGEAEMARRRARRNLERFPADVDAVLTAAAGCGSGMKAYRQLFAGEAEEPRAAAFADRVEDASTYLARLEPSFSRAAEERLVAYHDPCHLAHAQRERRAPRALLEAAGFRLVEPQGWEVCCGSAGIYNVEQPAVAERLGREKAERLLATGADVVVSANIGCLVQIERHLRQLGDRRPVRHLFELLAERPASTGG